MPGCMLPDGADPCDEFKAHGRCEHSADETPASATVADWQDALHFIRRSRARLDENDPTASYLVKCVDAFLARFPEKTEPSRSVQRRVAAQKGEPAPTFAHWSKDPLVPYEGCNCRSCEAARAPVSTSYSGDTRRESMTPQAKRALEYIRNTGGNATIAIFDDDHEPIGPQLRKEIIPAFAMVDGAGRLILTDAGRNELE
jgi:hypothetical protein